MARTRRPRRVLLVEDNKAARCALQTLLELEGYDVDTAENGRAGLQHLRTNVAPFVIVLDLQMPVMGGVAFRHAQLADRQLRRIPVVVCSGAPLDGVKKQLRATAYFRKPLDIDAFLSAIHRLARSR